MESFLLFYYICPIMYPSHGDVSIRREGSLPTADRRDLDVKRI